MLRRKLQLVLAVVVVFSFEASVSISGCSLDESGIADASGVDVETDTQADVPDDVAACESCESVLQAGWQLIAYAPGTSACPSGEAREQVILGAEAGAQACDCACDPGSACTTGSLTVRYSTSSCSQNTVLAVNGGCVGNVGALSDDYQVDFAPQGSCASRIVMNDAAVTSTSAVLCHPPDTCDPDLCNGNAPNGFAACIISAGDQPCPLGPFQNRSNASAGVSLECSSCACGAPNPICVGNLTFYSDAICTVTALQVDAGVGCNPTGTNASGAAYRWNGQALDAGCSAIGSRDASLTLLGVRTICCR